MILSIIIDYNLLKDNLCNIIIYTKVYKMDKLPNDIIIKILRENKMNKQNEMYKKRMNLFIKYLDYYFDEHGESCADNMFVGKDIRTDCRFLENENLWDTSFDYNIRWMWGDDEINDFMDEDF